VATRPDKRHIASQYVYELRQLIKICRAQYASEAGYPGVMFDCLAYAGKVAKFDAHRPELQHLDDGATLAPSFLSKQRWAWTVKFD
jgi:hypothetical protein